MDLFLILDMLDVFISLNTLLLNLLNRVEFARSDVFNQTYLTKATSTDNLEPLEVVQTKLLLHWGTLALEMQYRFFGN